MKSKKFIFHLLLSIGLLMPSMQMKAGSLRGILDIALKVGPTAVMLCPYLAGLGYTIQQFFVHRKLGRIENKVNAIQGTVESHSEKLTAIQAKQGEHGGLLAAIQTNQAEHTEQFNALGQKVSTMQEGVGELKEMGAKNSESLRGLTVALGTFENNQHQELTLFKDMVSRKFQILSSENKKVLDDFRGV